MREKKVGFIVLPKDLTLAQQVAMQLKSADNLRTINRILIRRLSLSVQHGANYDKQIFRKFGVFDVAPSADDFIC